MKAKNKSILEQRLERVLDRVFPFKFWFWTMLFSPAILLFSNISSNSDRLGIFYYLFFIMVYSVIFSIPTFVFYYWIYGLLKKQKIQVYWLFATTLIIPTTGLYITFDVFLNEFQYSFFMYYFGGIILSFCWLFLIGNKNRISEDL